LISDWISYLILLISFGLWRRLNPDASSSSSASTFLNGDLLFLRSPFWITLSDRSGVVYIFGKAVSNSIG